MMRNNRIEQHRAKVYRTDHYTPEQIEHLKESATRQEKIIARWFWKHPEELIGPTILHDRCGYQWEVTSTRRSITNLTKAGILLKTDATAPSTRGGSEHQWKWRTPQDPKTAPTQRDMFGTTQPRNGAYSQ